MHSINDLTAAARTTKRAIRLWEREGLLGTVERDAQGRRMYTDMQYMRAKVVSAAQRSCMSLEAIKFAKDWEILRAIDENMEFLRDCKASVRISDFDL